MKTIEEEEEEDFLVEPFDFFSSFVFVLGFLRFGLFQLVEFHRFHLFDSTFFDHSIGQMSRSIEIDLKRGGGRTVRLERSFTLMFAVNATFDSSISISFMFRNASIALTKPMYSLY